MNGFDLELTRAVSELGSWLYWPMKILTKAGQEQYYFIAIVVLLWCWNYKRSVYLTVLVPASALVIGMLKEVIHLRRPSDIIDDVVAVDGYGMPSGHAASATIFWLYCASLIRKRLFWGAAVGIIALIGLSRVYFMSHSPLQVLAGVFVGLLVLAAFVSAVRLRGRGRLAGARAKKILVAGLIIAAGVAVTLSASTLYDDGTGYEDVASVVETAPLLFGFVVGLILMGEGRDRLEVKSSWWKQGVKLIVAYLSISVYLRLGDVVEDTDLNKVVGYAILYIGSVATGMWFTYVGPMVLARFGLMRFAVRQDRPVERVEADRVLLG